MLTIEVKVDQQKLRLLKNNSIIKEYNVSTAKNGVGETFGSEKTPRGWHMVRAKIGKDCPVNTVFVERRPTGEIYQSGMRERLPGRDWILTRILWLSGLELGKNRLGSVDTMRRYIYIHGTPDEVQMGVPGSRGCIRMRNIDLIELFDMTPAGTRIHIA